MIWHYDCPECGQPVEIDWEWLKEEIICPSCNTQHYPPTPSEDHFAYVGTDTWPKEMETAVIALRGTTCAAPGCFQNYSALVHRRPVSAGGRTSVDNLIPLCAAHAEAKGTRDYDEWVATLKAEESRRPVPDELAGQMPTLGIGLGAAPPRPVTNTVIIASSTFGQVGSGQFCIRAPFLHLGVNRLLFDYDWQTSPGSSAKVMLAAWPCEESHEPVAVGTNLYDGLVSEKEHVCEQGSRGGSRLELMLPTSYFGRWVAVVLVRGEGLVLGDYVLAATD